MDDRRYHRYIFVGDSIRIFYYIKISCQQRNINTKYSRMDLLQAEKLLDEMELIITISKEENHPMIEKGLIISQEPEAQMIVKKGSAISVVLSEGPIMVKVPNILNMSMINAQEKLAEDGLNLGEVTRVYHEQILSEELFIKNLPKAKS